MTSARHAAHNDTIYQLEPDVKDAPGGLRDMAAARLLTLLAHEPAALDEDALEQAENFALRIRGLLHLAARRNANVLSHDMQELVTERLRIPDADATQRVEATLTATHDCRLLERLVAGFERIRGRMIRDFYHKHTVDEHTLLAIRCVERLVGPAAARTRFAGLQAEIPPPERLVLALLLHDVAKWKEEHHADETALQEGVP